MDKTHIDLTTLFTQLKTTPSASLESELIEFKEFKDECSLHNSKELAEEISAFANKNGGLIIIGVRDSDNIKNDNFLDHFQGFKCTNVLLCLERIKGKIKPSISIKIWIYNFENKPYLIIFVPCVRYSLVTTSSGKVYIRDLRSSRPMLPEEIENKVKTLQTYDWSSEELDIHPIESLDKTAIVEASYDYIKRRNIEHGLDTMTFLESTGITKNGILTKAGLLFLGKDDIIQKTLGDFEYRFSWKRKNGELVINDVWSGCIWNAIKRAKDHFRKCNWIIPLNYKEKEYSAPAMDDVAFHEAYLTALVHRDYSIDGMISVTYANRELRISSPGIFYGGVTPDNIAMHEPRHRNKALAKILMLYHLVDRAGMGVLRMGIRSLMYGRSFPKFTEKHESVEVTMATEYLRPAIFLMSINQPDRLSIAELYIFNLVYGIGYITVNDLQKRLEKLCENPWQTIIDAIDKNIELELSGTSKNIYVAINKEWCKLFDVGRHLKKEKLNEKYIALYKYLKVYTAASNQDLSSVLRYKHSTQTSRFLKNTGFVKRTGSGPKALWSLVPGY